MNYKMLVELRKYEEDVASKEDAPFWYTSMLSLTNADDSWIDDAYKEICESENASYKNNVEKFEWQEHLVYMYALCHCKVANNKFNEGDTLKAFELMSNALTYIGCCVGMRLGVASGAGQSIDAIIKAEKRHKEHKDMKKDIFEWLDKNWTGEKSKDATAAELSGKEVPASFRAIRKWITEWDKLRSTSKEQPLPAQRTLNQQTDFKSQ